MSRNACAEVTGKMPLSGKHITRYMFQRGKEASREGSIKGKFANAFGLGALAAMHAVQVKFGIKAFEHNENNTAMAGFDALYITANAMAAYTQTYLGLKVLGTKSENITGVTPEGLAVEVPSRIQEHEAAKLDDISLLELAVTLGGQALFFATINMPIADLWS